MANYSYLWDGTKLTAVDASGDGLVYLGSFVYRKQNDSLRFESAGFTEGRFVAGVGSQIDRRYFVADHLGSVRTVLNGSGQVLERSDYQPFGLRWNDNAQIVSDNRYRYNGKEDQSFVSLPYSDYGARMYDPNVGRWIETDPLAEKDVANSPFAFCGNNPILRIDKDGRKWVDANGNKVWEPGKGWTDYAKSEQIRAGILLRSTTTGMAQFNKLVDSRLGIQVDVNNTDRNDTGVLGNNQMDIAVYSDGSAEVTSSKITIYTKMTDEFASETGISKDASLAGIFGHEIEHSTNENAQTLVDNKAADANLKEQDRSIMINTI